jgi:hypothetical protein
METKTIYGIWEPWTKEVNGFWGQWSRSAKDNKVFFFDSEAAAKACCAGDEVAMIYDKHFRGNSPADRWCIWQWTSKPEYGEWARGSDENIQGFRKKEEAVATALRTPGVFTHVMQFRPQFRGQGIPMQTSKSQMWGIWKYDPEFPEAEGRWSTGIENGPVLYDNERAALAACSSPLRCNHALPYDADFKGFAAKDGTLLPGWYWGFWHDNGEGWNSLIMQDYAAVRAMVPAYTRVRIRNTHDEGKSIPAGSEGPGQQWGIWIWDPKEPGQKAGWLGESGPMLFVSEADARRSRARRRQYHVLPYDPKFSGFGSVSGELLPGWRWDIWFYEGQRDSPGWANRQTADYEEAERLEGGFPYSKRAEIRIRQVVELTEGNKTRPIPELNYALKAKWGIWVWHPRASHAGFWREGTKGSRTVRQLFDSEVEAREFVRERQLPSFHSHVLPADPDFLGFADMKGVLLPGWSWGVWVEKSADDSGMWVAQVPENFEHAERMRETFSKSMRVAEIRIRRTPNDTTSTPVEKTTWTPADMEDPKKPWGIWMEAPLNGAAARWVRSAFESAEAATAHIQKSGALRLLGVRSRRFDAGPPQSGGKAILALDKLEEIQRRAEDWQRTHRSSENIAKKRVHAIMWSRLTEAEREAYNARWDAVVGWST